MLLLLFFGLVLVVSIPAVQTWFGSYATERINKTFGTDIVVKKVGLQFNGDIELKNILIRDHKNDTLISINELNSSILSFTKTTWFLVILTFTVFIFISKHTPRTNFQIWIYLSKNLKKISQKLKPPLNYPPMISVFLIVILN